MTFKNLINVDGINGGVDMEEYDTKELVGKVNLADLALKKQLHKCETSPDIKNRITFRE